MESGKVVLISFDDPECGGAADEILYQIKEITESTKLAIDVRLLAVPSNCSHKDVILSIFKDLFSIDPSNIFIVSLLSKENPKEYRKIKNICDSAMIKRIKRSIISCLSNYKDISLLSRNLVKTIIIQNADE